MTVRCKMKVENSYAMAILFGQKCKNCVHLRRFVLTLVVHTDLRTSTRSQRKVIAHYLTRLKFGYT